MTRGRCAIATDPQLTPMFRQWRKAKERVPDAILLFRMGDFYEMFAEDAEIASQVLEIALTARESAGRKVPMCGVPYHSIERYIPRLLEAGLRVAICEQTSDPKQSPKLVDRDVIRVITRGTALEEFLLDGRASNYLAAVGRGSVVGPLGLAWIDVSTGEFRAAEVPGGRAALVEEIKRLAPAEVVVPESLAAELALDGSLSDPRGPTVSVFEDPVRFLSADQELCRHFGVSSLLGFGIEGKHAAVEAAAVALRYLSKTRLDLAGNVRAIALRQAEDVLILDSSTQRNLELVRPLRGDGTHGTLLEVLDRTRTLPGGRLMRKWILEPLRDPDAISARLDVVEHLVSHSLLRRDVVTALSDVRDLERLTSRATTGTASPRDLAAIRATLEALPALRHMLDGDVPSLLATIRDALDPMEDLRDLLASALVDGPPVSAREGAVIRDGYNGELDELRGLASGGREWIAELEATERGATGIPSLKVGYNSVFGYYLEVTHANAERVPERYIRKQTLRNAERYVTPELKAMEERILSAQERMAELEYDLFLSLRGQVAAQAERLLSTAGAAATLDVLSALAEVAASNDYTRPQVARGDTILITAGRHPIVERLAAVGGFVPNDAELACDGTQIAIVTGPNMAGKSTYLRQTALIVLMAQMGSFVPAREADIGTVDRIFTRVGAHDDLASGQSTFMVEMTETANILHNATRNSLVILDEIGRGTSTFDGLSIAWAVAEHLHNAIGAKTLFATHYHQLNALADELPRVRNFRVLVREEGESMVFIRRIAPGGTDRSYGIQVGRLAGLPQAVVERAKQVLWSLEGQDVRTVASAPQPALLSPPQPARGQLSLFGEPAVDPRVEYVERLKALDVDNMTPMQALTLLHDLRRTLKDQGTD